MILSGCAQKNVQFKKMDKKKKKNHMFKSLLLLYARSKMQKFFPVLTPGPRKRAARGISKESQFAA